MNSKSKFTYLLISAIFLIPHANCDDAATDVIDPCIQCLCHASTGCNNLKTCANYSISYDYWTTAGSPKVGRDMVANADHYRECMKDDRCIIDTIRKYTETFDEQDCYCDGNIDCRDMLSLHLYGSQCRPVMQRHFEVRYNNCARFGGLKQQLLDPNVECVNPYN